MSSWVQANGAGLMRRSSRTNVEIREALDGILNSRTFGRAEQLKKFLSFLVEETLAGRGSQITAESVAVAVFDKSNGFKSSSNPVVRVAAARLRKRLQLYEAYEKKDGFASILISPGSYVPEFRHGSTREPSAQGNGNGANHQPVFATSPNPVRRPLIVVRGLSALPQDDTTAAVAESLTEEILIELCKNDWISVAHVDASKSISGATPARGLRLSVEGAVRRTESKVRVSIRMRDLQSDRFVWSLAQDLELADLQEIDRQQTLAAGIRDSISDHYTGQVAKLQRRLFRFDARTNGFADDPYGSFVQYSHSHSAKDHARALHAIQCAAQVDPDDISILCLLAELESDSLVNGLGGDESILDKAEQILEHARSIDPSHTRVVYATGLLSLIRGDAAQAKRQANKIFEHKDDHVASVVADAAWLLGMSGEIETSSEILEIQLQNHSGYPGWWHGPAYQLAYRSGDYEKALEEARAFGMPDFFWGPLGRAAALGQLGKSQDAHEEISRLKELNPSFAKEPSRYMGYNIASSDMVEHLLEGLKKAGLSTN